LRHDRALGNALGYPEGVHVNCARIDPEGALSVLMYEAGVENITPACGTGSTAAAYVCARIGASALPTRVIVLGGELVIGARGASPTMQGPAKYVPPITLDWRSWSPARPRGQQGWRDRSGDLAERATPRVMPLPGTR
jgi:diaminopimelate epimerase